MRRRDLRRGILDDGVIVAGDYRIDGVLGDGGMGVVYEATELSLEKKVALKLLPSDLSEDPGFRERFRREGPIQAKIDHPHVIDVFRAGQSEYGLFLAMRLVRGPTLRDLIVTGKLTVQRTVYLLTQVASALDAAHEAGLVHRDIKPQNILIDERREHSYLADFGVTKARDEAGLTRAGQLVGTIDYMAPEQFRGHEATERSDIYSFGAVLYECLVGTVPYPRPTDGAVMYAHLSEPPPSVREHLPGVPGVFDAVIAKAMAKEAEQRYVYAADMMNDLAEGIAAAVTETGALPPPAPATSVRTVAGETVLAGEGVPETTISHTPAPETSIAVPAAAEEAPAAPETSLSPVPASATLAAAAATMEVPADGTVITAEPAHEEPLSSTMAMQPAVALPEEAREIVRPERQARRRRSLAPVAVVVGIAGLAAVGFVGGRATGSGASAAKHAPADGLVRSGPASFIVPAAWTKRAAPAIPGMALDGPLSLSPRRGAGLVSGTVKPAWPTFLPPSFRVGEQVLGRREIVRLGHLTAYRYSRVTPRGFSGVVTVYAVPQSRSEQIVACYARSAAATGPLSACDGIAATLRLRGARAYPLEPSASYAASLGLTLRDLNTARSAGLKTLAAAKTPAAQGAAAGVLAKAYESALRRARATKPNVYVAPAHRRIEEALTRAASAYSQLAGAAQSSNAKEYGRARTLIGLSEQALRDEIVALEKLGFTV